MVVQSEPQHCGHCEGEIVWTGWGYVHTDPSTSCIAFGGKVAAPDESIQQNPCPFTKEQHHELCLGIMALCYPHVNAATQQAIREGVESAALLGFPVSTRNLEQGGPLFSGGYA